MTCSFQQCYKNYFVVLGSAVSIQIAKSDFLSSIHKALDEMGIDLVQDPVRVQYIPDDDELAQCREMGLLTGRRLREILNKEKTYNEKMAMYGLWLRS